MSKRTSLEVLMKWDGKEYHFSGSADEVISSILKLISDVYPTFELVKSLTFTADTEDLLKKVQGIFALTPDEIVVLVPRGRLNDKEAVALHLVRRYIAFLFGKVEKPTLSVKELSENVKKTEGVISARAADLVNEWLAERAEKGEFKITPAGVKWFTENIVPKLKAGDKRE